MGARGGVLLVGFQPLVVEVDTAHIDGIGTLGMRRDPILRQYCKIFKLLQKHVTCAASKYCQIWREMSPGLNGEAVPNLQDQFFITRPVLTRVTRVSASSNDMRRPLRKRCFPGGFDGMDGRTSHRDSVKVVCHILSRTGRKRSESAGMIRERGGGKPQQDNTFRQRSGSAGIPELGFDSRPSQKLCDSMVTPVEIEGRAHTCYGGSEYRLVTVSGAL